MSKGAQNNSKKVAVLTSGGDASGMNTCVRATVRYALRNGFEVYGVKHGYLGLYKNDIRKFEYSSVSVFKISKKKKFTQRQQITYWTKESIT